MNSYYAAGIALNAVVKDPARTYEIGLFLTLPARDNTGGVEVTGDGYIRQEFIAGDPSPTGFVFNANEIIFPEPPEDWGLAVGYCLFDDLGNLRRIGTLTEPKFIYKGNPPRFPPGTVVLGE